MPEIMCVSLSSEQKSFIKAKKLSPSLLFQTKIDEIRGFIPIGMYGELGNLTQKVQILAKRLDKMRDFLENRGLINEFLEQENKYRAIEERGIRDFDEKNDRN